MRLSHKQWRRLLCGAVIISAFAVNGVSFAGEYFKTLTGWELSRYEFPDGEDESLTGIGVIDSEDNAYDGRGALHIWSGGTKANGIFPVLQQK